MDPKKESLKGSKIKIQQFRKSKKKISLNGKVNTVLNDENKALSGDELNFPEKEKEEKKGETFPFSSLIHIARQNSVHPLKEDFFLALEPRADQRNKMISETVLKEAKEAEEIKFLPLQADSLYEEQVDTSPSSPVLKNQQPVWWRPIFSLHPKDLMKQIIDFVKWVIQYS